MAGESPLQDSGQIVDNIVLLAPYKVQNTPKTKGLVTDTVWKCQVATALEGCEPETLNQ